MSEHLNEGNVVSPEDTVEHLTEEQLSSIARALAIQLIYFSMTKDELRELVSYHLNTGKVMYPQHLGE